MVFIFLKYLKKDGYIDYDKDDLLHISNIWYVDSPPTEKRWFDTVDKNRLPFFVYPTDLGKNYLFFEDRTKASLISPIMTQTTDIPEPDSANHPRQPAPKADKIPYFVFGCISLFAIFFALYFLKTLTADQRFFFKILTSHLPDCAGVAATLPGIADLKYKGTISASGAVVVFLIVIGLKFQRKFTLTRFFRK